MATHLFEPGASDVLYLVDLSSYVFRAFHAIAPLSSPAGEPTNATFGTVTMLERLLRQCRPARLAIVQDSPEETFRKKLYPEYKAHRPPQPPELRVQLTRIEAILRAMGFSVFRQPGVEADDLIATAVRQVREMSQRAVILSADKDLMTLVGSDVVLWDTMRDRVVGPPEVRARFGVEPNQLRDLLALMGDSSDNVPGVPSVGPKTARNLLESYGDLKGIYENLEQIARKKLHQALSTHRQQAWLSQELVTLKDDCDLDIRDHALTTSGGDTEQLRALYEELGFTRQLSALNARAGGGADGSLSEQSSAKEGGANATTESLGAAWNPAPVESIVDLASLQSAVSGAARTGRLCVVPAVVPAGEASVIGLGLWSGEGAARYLPLGHRYVGAPKPLELASVNEALNDLAKAHPSVRIGAHDGKQLAVSSARQGLSLPPLGFDTLLASYLLDPDSGRSLERLAEEEISARLPDLAPLTNPRRGRHVPLDELRVEEVAEHFALCAQAVGALWNKLETELERAGLLGLFNELELPLTELLAQLELRGVLVDTAPLSELSTVLDRELSQLEAEAQRLAGRPFNVNSPRQLETLLFDEFKLKPLKRTKTSRSTDAATLEALSASHELPRVVLEIRKLAKLKGTYVDALPALVRPKSGRIHTRWGQATAATGRLSSSDPNLQNIPVRSEVGRSIRRAFVAPSGHQLVSADYSQIELRVLAHLARDAVLINAFQTGQDVHTRTAMEIFDLPAGGVDAEHRRRAKAVNFGVIYGQGESGLAKSLGIPRAEAGAFIAAYFQRYEGVRRFMDETLRAAREEGATRTLLGRRRLLPDIRSNHRGRRQAAERIAMNTPIQGSAADILKLAMLALREPATPGCRMVMTVHDELIFEVPDAEVAEATERIRVAMQQAYELCVPLIVDVGSGPAWSEAH